MNRHGRQNEVIIYRNATSLKPELRWDHPQWACVPTIELAHVRPESSDHHPRVSVKVACDNMSVAVLFRTQDRYVRSLCTRYQGMVCCDSCVALLLELTEPIAMTPSCSELYESRAASFRR